MKADFDIAANVYDDTFTNTEIGRRQRNRVWHYLKKALPHDRSLNILELNCGTGEDAIFLARQGHRVIATDISEGMLAICKHKVIYAGLENKVKVQQLDINQLGNTVFTEKFDLVFSNFGGLNCLDTEQIKQLSNAIKNKLNPGGKFIAVIMPDFCFVESLYFLAKMDFKKAFRRKTKSFVLANVDGVGVKTWYYNPADMQKVLDENFIEIKTHAIGFVPAYLNEGLVRNEQLKNIVFWAERQFCKRKWSSASDHFLLDAYVKTSLRIELKNDDT